MQFSPMPYSVKREGSCHYMLVSSVSVLCFYSHIVQTDFSRHIFCLVCADKLGLSHQPSSGRQCPACQHTLVNPDDVASTILSPTEDYKASILSGLDPTTIMECAGRALMFWSYQATQEVYVMVGISAGALQLLTSHLTVSTRSSLQKS